MSEQLPAPSVALTSSPGRPRGQSCARAADDRAIVLFFAPNHDINLVGRPGRTSIVQGGTRDRDIRDRDGVRLIVSMRSRQVVRANCAARSV
jgi:hypothetical protein